MRYKLIQQINPKDIESDGKCYAIPVDSGKTVMLGSLVKPFSGCLLLTKVNLNDVLQNLVNRMLLVLLMGRNLQSGGMGMIRIPFSSSGMFVKIIFTH